MVRPSAPSPLLTIDKKTENQPTAPPFPLNPLKKKNNKKQKTKPLPTNSRPKSPSPPCPCPRPRSPLFPPPNKFATTKPPHATSPAQISIRRRHSPPRQPHGRGGRGPVRGRRRSPPRQPCGCGGRSRPLCTLLCTMPLPSPSPFPSRHPRVKIVGHESHHSLCPSRSLTPPSVNCL